MYRRIPRAASLIIFFSLLFVDVVVIISKGLREEGGYFRPRVIKFDIKNEMFIYIRRKRQDIKK